MAKKLNIETYKKSAKTIAHYLSPHKRALVWLAIVSLGSAVCEALLPFLGGKLIDAILGKSSVINILGYALNPFITILFVWLTVEVADDLFSWMKSFQQEDLTATLHADYIINGYYKLLRFPISFHKKNKMGEIAQRISRASDFLERIVNQILIDLLPQFLSIFVALVIVFLIKPILAAILLTGIIIYAIALVKVTPRISTLSHQMNRAYSKAHGDAYDTVLNIASVKQASAEENEQRKLFRNFNLRAVQYWTKYIKIDANLSLFQRLIIEASRFGIFIVSFYLVRNGSMSVGDLVAFNGYAAMLFGPFVILGRNWSLIQNGLTAIERSEEILRKPEEIYIPQDAVILGELKGEVEFRNLIFRYGQKQNLVLDDISFKVSPGEAVALVGESGVGKSTLLDFISGYHFPTSGAVLIDGHKTSTLDLKVLRSAIAIVPQEILLFNDTVKNNIRYGRFGASDKAVERAAKLANADEFIKRFPKQYGQMVGERGIKLSVGQKQRLAIARAILRDPKILILDEPTSALDAKSEKFIAESLEELMKGRTTFIIAHRLSTVRRANRIVVLDKGKIAEIGTHEELIAKP